MDHIVLLSILTLLASFIGTISGFGTSTIMVPVLSMFFPLTVTLLFVGIIHFFGDIWKMILFKKGVNWTLIRNFGIPGIITSYIGATLTLSFTADLLEKIFGFFLMAYVIFILLKQDWKLPRNISTAMVGGSLSGFFAGLFGVGGAIRGTFLSTFNLPKAIYIFTSGAIAFIIDIVRITTYLFQGTSLEDNLVYGMVVFIPISFLGAWFGKKFVGHIPQNKFRSFIGFFLGVIALKFLLF